MERVLVTNLCDGSILVVGDELSGVDEVRRAVLVAFGWALAATIVVGTCGGLLLSAGFLRRIDAMTATAQDIVADDLSRRIPLTKSSADLKRLAAAFNKMLDRISALLEANKQVSSAIAGDSRKPLARVLRGLETARSGPADLAKFEEAVDAASSDIDGVLETFGALLRIGQIETGARLANFENVDLAAIAQEVAEAFQPAAADEGKTLTFELSARLPMASDCELLKQLTANLIDNSIRHTPAGSRIMMIESHRRLWRKIDCRRRRPRRASLRPRSNLRAFLSRRHRARDAGCWSRPQSRRRDCPAARRQSIRFRQWARTEDRRRPDGYAQRFLGGHESRKASAA